MIRLRIIAGSLKGRYIKVTGPAEKNFRPTLERTRQAIAETIKHTVTGVRVADVCAGSGAIGFEMLSRGAVSVDFVESDRMRAGVIRGHIREFGCDNTARVLGVDVRRFAATAQSRYGLVYYDPPYADEALAALVPGLLGALVPGGMLLHERGSGASVAVKAPGNGYELLQSRVYGESTVDYYGRMCE